MRNYTNIHIIDETHTIIPVININLVVCVRNSYRASTIKAVQTKNRTKNRNHIFITNNRKSCSESKNLKYRYKLNFVNFSDDHIQRKSSILHCTYEKSSSKNISMRNLYKRVWREKCEVLIHIKQILAAKQYTTFIYTYYK